MTNVVFSTFAGYAFAQMKFRGKGLFMAIMLSTLLLPGEVTLTSQYLTIKSLGAASRIEFGMARAAVYINSTFIAEIAPGRKTPTRLFAAPKDLMVRY